MLQLQWAAPLIFPVMWQIQTKIVVKRTRLENLVNAVKNMLDSVTRRRGNDLIDVEMLDLESEDSAAQRRNQ